MESGKADFKDVPGVKKKILWGNHDVGPYGAFTKFDPGLINPLHTHTNEVRIVVLQGAYIYKPQNGNERRVVAIGADLTRTDMFTISLRPPPEDMAVAPVVGRSPGLRVIASLGLPRASRRSSGISRQARRSQLRGQPRHRASTLTAFPFASRGGGNRRSRL